MATVAACGCGVGNYRRRHGGRGCRRSNSARCAVRSPGRRRLRTAGLLLVPPGFGRGVGDHWLPDRMDLDCFGGHDQWDISDVQCLDHLYPDRPHLWRHVLDHRCGDQLPRNRNPHLARAGDPLHAARTSYRLIGPTSRRARNPLLATTRSHRRGHGDRLSDRRETHRERRVGRDFFQHRVRGHHPYLLPTPGWWDLRLSGIGHQCCGSWT